MAQLFAEADPKVFDSVNFHQEGCRVTALNPVTNGPFFVTAKRKEKRKAKEKTRQETRKDGKEMPLSVAEVTRQGQRSILLHLHWQHQFQQF